MQKIKDTTYFMCLFFHKNYFILGEVIRTACIQYMLNMANEGYINMLSKYAHFPKLVNLFIKIRCHVVVPYLEACFNQSSNSESNLTSTIHSISVR